MADKNYNYKPSVAASKEALGLGVKVDAHAYEQSPKGVGFSLMEVARRIREGKDDLFVKSWAGKVLIDAGKPTSTITQAQAILDAVRKRTMFVPDPVGTEMNAAARYTLCLDDKLCIPASDCDDISVAVGSALMSMGIPVQVVGQSFKGKTDHPTHVLVAADTKLGWKLIDGTHPTFSVGEAFPSTKEWWVDPMSPDVSSLVGTAGRTGDFVGVGGGVFDHAGDFIGLGEPLSAKEKVIDRDYNEVASMIGLGDTSAIIGASYDALVTQLQSVTFMLEKSVNDLGASLVQVQQTRAQLQPNLPYDPEPFAIASVADFPANGIWTANMESASVALWQTGSVLVQACYDALAGAREVIVDESTGEAYIASIVGTDPWVIHQVVATAVDAIFAFINPAGAIVSGFSGRTGKVFSAAEVQTQAAALSTQTTPTATGVSGGPLIVIGVLGVAAIAGLTVCYAISRQCETAKIVAREAVNKTIVDGASNGKYSPQQAQSLLNAVSKNRITETEADAKAAKDNPFTQGLGDIESMIVWTVVGGVAFAGIFAAWPLLQAMGTAGAEAYRKKHEAKP